MKHNDKETEETEVNEVNEVNENETELEDSEGESSAKAEA